MVEAFLNLGEDYQLAIADVTERMGAGMAEFITKEVRAALRGSCHSVRALRRLAGQVHTLKDYNRYCYYVAGLVGVGLSRLFVAGGA